MSLIHLEKQGEVWRSRVEGHFILGVHPIETLRKGLPEAMAQAVIDHCAMAGGDVAAFAARLMAEIEALAPIAVPKTLVMDDEARRLLDDAIVGPLLASPEPRRARVPRKAAVVAPEAGLAPVEPVAAPKEGI